MNILPNIKVYQTAKKEVMIECDWIGFTIIQSMIEMLQTYKRCVMVGFGSGGIALGIMISMSLFSTTMPLYANAKEVPEPLTHIVIPKQDLTLTLKNGIKVVEAENKSIVSLGLFSNTAAHFESIEVGEKVYLVRDRNNVQQYKMSEKRTIEIVDFEAFVNQVAAPVVIYTPEDLLSDSYRVFIMQ